MSEQTKVLGDWWCPECKCALPGSCVTFEERCDTCGTLVRFVPEPHREDVEANLYEIAAKADPSHAWHFPTPDGVCRRCGYDATDPEAREPCRGASITGDVEVLPRAWDQATGRDGKQYTDGWNDALDAVAALRSRPVEPEPVAWAVLWGDEFMEKGPYKTKAEADACVARNPGFAMKAVAFYASPVAPREEKP